jgi:hypothetical protein
LYVGSDPTGSPGNSPSFRRTKRANPFHSMSHLFSGRGSQTRSSLLGSTDALMDGVLDCSFLYMDNELDCLFRDDHLSGFLPF